MALLDRAKQVAAEFEYTTEDVNRGVKEFLREMDEGLEKDGTCLSQIPTYVTAVPNGTEKGVFLAIDLGGTNFRVCSVQLHGNSTFSLAQSKVPIPHDLMVAKTAKELYVFLAKQIETFLQTHHSERFEAHIRRRRTMSTKEGYRDVNVFRLGFTFSFPVQQEGLNKGTLIRWTKGFHIEDAIGKDVCALLQTEIDKLHLPVRVAAVVNDTVGTLMARSYTSPGKKGALLGCILGTGTNGAYVEKLEKVTKLTSKGKDDAGYDASTGEMVLNMEWGSFDNHLRVLPNTQYDIAVDKDTPNPGIHMFEKRVSGMFLGEILRRTILTLLEDGDSQLFKDSDSSTNDIRSTTTIADDSALYKPWGIDTSFLSVVQADNSGGLKATRATLDKDLGVSAPSYEDAQAVKILVHAIGKRSARLIAVAFAGVVIHSGRLGHQKQENGEYRQSKDSGSGSGLTEAAKSTAEKVEMAVLPLVDTAPSAMMNPVEEDEMVDIGADGSLIEYYPGYEELLREALREIPELGPEGEKRISIGIAKDGSGVGAALIALMAGKGGPPNEEGFLIEGDGVVGEEKKSE
ncbi:MAG: glucokinase [Peltula sp. TS41687]|nr:MAG: glucokinase [Peltula sp. TS41687]